MTEQKAIDILVRCKPLADKVIERGVDFALTEVEIDTLAAFKEVYQNGMAYRLLQQAGLTQYQYLALGKLAGARML
jgi:hypothetical protein